MGVTTTKHRFDFRTMGIPADGAVGDGPFTKLDTGGMAFSRTTGGLKMATTAIGLGCLYFNDDLLWDIDKLIRVRFRLAMTFTVADFTNTTIGFGVTSARNNTLDNITEAAIFRVEANDSNLYMESDDGTNNNDDVDSTLDVVSAAFETYEIDFMTGVQTKAPPAVSAGGKAAVQFFASSSGFCRHVGGVSQLFDISNYAGGLQPFVQYETTDNADSGDVTVMWIEVELKDSV